MTMNSESLVIFWQVAPLPEGQAKDWSPYSQFDSFDPVLKQVYCLKPSPDPVFPADRSDRRWVFYSAADAILSLNSALAQAGRTNSELLVIFGNCLPPSLNDFQILWDTLMEDPHFGFCLPRFRDAETGSIYPIDPQGEKSGVLPLTGLQYLPYKYILQEYIGPCFLIREELTANLGLLNPEAPNVIQALANHMIMARRLGFRSVVSNRAVVDIRGGLPALTECIQNLHQARNRIPSEKNLTPSATLGHPLLLAQESSLHQIHRTTGQIDKSLLIDMTGLGPIYNGTSFTMLRLAESLSQIEHDWQIRILAFEETAAFHRLSDRFPDWPLIDCTQNLYHTVAFRPNQPWSLNQIVQLHRSAYFNIFTILDTIAWDICYCAPDNLEDVWNFLAQYTDLIVFDSLYTQKRFNARFPTSPSVREQILSYSFNPADYTEAGLVKTNTSPYWLVVGNELDHKWIPATVDVVRTAFPFQPLRVIGFNKYRDPLIKGFLSGHLPDETFEQLFAEADLIIYPSFYEGFGLPILKGLSYGKTVIVRSSQLVEEIGGQYSGGGALITFSSPLELVEKIGGFLHGLPLQTLPLGGALSPGQKPRTWEDVAYHLLNILEETIRNPRHSNWMRREKFLHYANQL